jgi:hypothetical protein
MNSFPAFRNAVFHKEKEKANGGYTVADTTQIMEHLEYGIYVLENDVVPCVLSEIFFKHLFDFIFENLA